MVYKIVYLSDIDFTKIRANQIESCIRSIADTLDTTFCSMGISMDMSVERGETMKLAGSENIFAKIGDILSVITVLDGQKIAISDKAKEKGIYVSDVKTFLKAIAIPLAGRTDPLSYSINQSNSLVLKVGCEEKVFLQMQDIIEKVMIQIKTETEIQNAVIERGA